MRPFEGENAGRREVERAAIGIGDAPARFLHEDGAGGDVPGAETRLPVGVEASAATQAKLSTADPMARMLRQRTAKPSCSARLFSRAQRIFYHYPVPSNPAP